MAKVRMTVGALRDLLREAAEETQWHRLLKRIAQRFQLPVNNEPKDTRLDLTIDHAGRPVLAVDYNGRLVSVTGTVLRQVFEDEATEIAQSIVAQGNVPEPDPAITRDTMPAPAQSPKMKAAFDFMTRHGKVQPDVATFLAQIVADGRWFSNVMLGNVVDSWVDHLFHLDDDTLVSVVRQAFPNHADMVMDVIDEAVQGDNTVADSRVIDFIIRLFGFDPDSSLEPAIVDIALEQLSRNGVIDLSTVTAEQFYSSYDVSYRCAALIRSLLSLKKVTFLGTWYDLVLDWVNELVDGTFDGEEWVKDVDFVGIFDDDATHVTREIMHAATSTAADSIAVIESIVDWVLQDIGVGKGDIPNDIKEGIRLWSQGVWR